MPVTPTTTELVIPPDPPTDLLPPEAWSEQDITKDLLRELHREY